MKNDFGCNIVITNSYILYRRMAETAVSKGVHHVIGFDGVVATDSGGYQVLEYGDVAVEPAEIARFQELIGTDIAIPLDKPTGLLSRSRAAETVERTISNVEATMRALGNERRAAWTAPIQGGLYRDLIERCVKAYAEHDFDLYALGSPTPLLENYMYDRLAAMIAAAKLALPPEKPLHLFGAGHPMMFAFAVALGCDTFDSASYALFAKENRYMLPTGTAKLEALEYLPCGCRVCASMTARELRSLEPQQRMQSLA